jgi:hypothetical protein
MNQMLNRTCQHWDRQNKTHSIISKVRQWCFGVQNGKIFYTMFYVCSMDENGEHNLTAGAKFHHHVNRCNSLPDFSSQPSVLLRELDKCEMAGRR